MSPLKIFLVLAISVCLAYAYNGDDSRVFVERSSPIPLPAGWTRLPTNAKTPRTLELIFALKQQNLDTLKEILYSVSDPQDSHYGFHLTLDQVTELVAPSDDDIREVTSWLISERVYEFELSASKDYIKVDIPTTTAARVFATKFYVYAHESGLTMELSPGPYSLPASIQRHVQFVSGLIGFPDIKEKKTPKGVDGKAIDPKVIRARYNVTAVGSHPDNSHAVAEFQGQYFSPSDLQTFWKDYVDFAPFRPVDKIVGVNVGAKPGVEASLDIQYIMGVAPNITTWFYVMTNFNFWNDLITWSYKLGNESTIPWVHSISYGSQGNYPPDGYQDRLDVEFQKLGVRGVSIIFASGDGGAGCGKGAEDPKFSKDCDCTFFPSFPATCPHITSVGATRFLVGNAGAEGAVQAFKSGGGFSVDFDLPSFQSEAVSGYLSSGVQLPQACAYNATGRATPDVSALGDVHFQVIVDGSDQPVGGTSASSPSFAAIISLLNDQRLHANKSTLGWLNPFIYQTAGSNPNAFYDVTVGDNEVQGCCKGSQIGGFVCAKGWDPVTGVGTPNFVALSKVVDAL